MAAGFVQASGYGTWIIAPTFAGFALGFALLGVGTSLVSGAFEAWLFDRLAAIGSAEHYQRVIGRVTAIALVAQLPAAAAAGLLFRMGGYQPVGWVSVGVCVTAAALASRFTEPPRHVAASGVPSSDAAAPGGYWSILTSGISEATRTPRVRWLLVAVVALAGLDGIDEYFPLLAADWHVATATVPLAITVIPLVGAAGAAWGGRGANLGGGRLAGILGCGLMLLAVAAALRLPVGLGAVALFYGLHQFVLVAVDARLQHRISGSARATVTSVASLGTELAAIGLYATWSAGGLWLVTAVWLLVAAGLPMLLREPATRRSLPS
jgi:hypothetical protein